MTTFIWWLGLIMIVIGSTLSAFNENSPLWPELGGREWTADEVVLEAKMVIEELIKKV